MSKFKFIDLFAGIGGFHQAMVQLGGECVFASEIDKNCIKIYNENFNIDSNHNIVDVKAEDIPYHDVLCAGFPCQPFSVAGNQKGFNDTRGTLFFEIERILKHHRTKYIILENVRNLITHDNGNTWRVIHSCLIDLGYRLTPEPVIVSPHQLGIPQLRERAFIVGVYDKDNTEPLDIKIDKRYSKEQNSIYDIINENDIVDNSYYLTENELYVLNAWDEFYKGIKEKVIGFPVWYDFFHYEGDLSDIKDWLHPHFYKNKELYKNNKEFINEWESKYNYLRDFTPTQKRFEWQASDSIDSLWEGIIQFRQSGIRVKAPTTFPTLVAMVQTPIIGKYKRRLTVQESARLQSFSDGFILDSNKKQAYKQLGNAVNVDVVFEIGKQLFSSIK